MKPCLVVMQPTFLPWSGYFDLMAQADDFVFLDDVQLEKQSWQTRNRWALGAAPHWMTVPVRHAHLAQTIAETEVLDATRWRDKLARGFALNYGRHPHQAEAREIIDALLAEPSRQLAGMNEGVIRFVAGRLGLTPRLHRASEIGAPGVRSARLIALCEHFGAMTYLSPVGSQAYLIEDGFAEQSPAALRFQNYQPRPYPQRGAAAFMSHLSMLDVVANLGWAGARDHVKEGAV